MKPERIDVVSAVIQVGSDIWLFQRPDSSDYPGRWETPGGKVEPGETDVVALEREILEELGCGCRVEPECLFVFDYPDNPWCQVRFYKARLLDMPELIQHAGMTRAPPGDLLSFLSDIVPGTRAYLESLA